MTPASAVHAARGSPVEVLEALGAAHYVGGSVPNSAHAVPCSSIDVDILAELAEAQSRP